MSKEIVEDTYGDDLYDPSLYLPTGRAETVDGFENVTEAEIDRFKAEEFLAIEGAFSPEQIADAIAAVEDIIDGKNETFRDKGVLFERGVKEQVLAAPDEERKTFVRKLQK